MLNHIAVCQLFQLHFNDDNSDTYVSVSRETVVAEEKRYTQNTQTQKVYMNTVQYMFEDCFMDAAD